MTAPRGKARNRLHIASDGPRWTRRRELELSVINRAASGTEAQSVETHLRLDPKDDGPVPQADAQGTAQ